MRIGFYSNFWGTERKFQFRLEDVSAMQLGTKLIYDTLEFSVGGKGERTTHSFGSFSSSRRKECFELCQRMMSTRETRRARSGSSCLLSIPMCLAAAVVTS